AAVASPRPPRGRPPVLRPRPRAAGPPGRPPRGLPAPVRRVRPCARGHGAARGPPAPPGARGRGRRRPGRDRDGPRGTGRTCHTFHSFGREPLTIQRVNAVARSSVPC